MARFDKYEPKGGGFRAPLAADQDATPGGVGDSDAPIAVGLNSDGEVVPGEGNSGVVGVLCLTQSKRAGDIVDVMTDGDVVEFGGTAGTAYFGATADGEISTGSTGDVYLGHTVEANRLVVRVETGRSAA